MKKNRVALVIISVILATTLFACSSDIDAGTDTNISITFMVDGEVYHEMEVKNDTTVRMPAEPQKDGFIFDGWYLSEDYEVEFTAGYLRQNKVEADITVYAKWSNSNDHGPGDQPPQDDGLVCFDANGGDVSITEKRYEIGAVMTDMPIPTRDGYDFVGWENADGESYTSASVMPDLDGETLYLYAEWKRQTSTYSDEYVQFSPAVEGIKNDDDFYLYYADKVDEYIYVELDIDYVGYGNAGKENNFRLGNWENLMFNTKEGCSLTWYTDSDFSRINGAQIFTLNYGSNIQFLTVTYQGIVRKTYLVDFYLLRDCYISLCDHIGGEPYTRVRVDEGGTFDQNYEWRLADKFEGDKRVYYNTSTRRYETFDYSTIINQDWTLYQTYASKEITYLDADGESKTLEIKPFEDVKLSTPSKEGYTFIGWQQPDKKMFTDIEGASRLQLTEDNYFETLTPIWEEDVFEKIDTVNSTKFELATPTVLYDNNGGLYKLVYYNQDNEICYSKQYSIKIRYDLFIWGGDSFNEFYTTTLTCPNVPGSYNLDSSMAEMIFGNSSYTTVYFAGWYTGQLGGGEKFDFTAPIYGDVTLYALMLPEDNSDAYENEPSGGQCHIPEPTKTDKAYFSGEEATLTAMGNPGYTWVGWYDGDTELTAEESYKVTLTTENKTYTAKWSKVTLEKTPAAAGSVSSLNGEYCVGDNVTVTATTNLGYTWLGWYDGDTKVSEDTMYTFTMSTENKTYTAKWEIVAEMQNFEFTSTSTTCTITGIKDKTVTTIVVPDHVTEIGENAFRECKSITSITIPDSVTTIGKFAFQDCTSLTSVTFGENSQLTTIGRFAFEHCDNLTSIAIPNGVINIGENAFWSCDNLISIVIPENVTSIGEGAFKYCDSLTSIEIPQSVISIGEGAFFYCLSLMAISVDEYNTEYKSIDGNLYSKDEKTLIQYAIGKTNTSFAIPDSVTTIGEYAFYNCTSLTSVTFGENSQLTSIDYGAFEKCSGLESINIPQSVISIGNYAFGECSKIESIRIPKNVTSIGPGAFYGCGSLDYVSFEDPNGWYVTEIEGATSGTYLQNLSLIVPWKKYITSTTYFCYYYWYKQS